MKKRNAVLSIALVGALVIGAVPALAQQNAPAAETDQAERAWPPAWVDMTVGELQAQVEARAEDRIAHIQDSPILSEQKKTERIAAINDLVAAVDAAATEYEAAGLVVSRTQLERQELRAARIGAIPDYESHLADDIERAQTRLARLTKVAGWAEAAGEDVTAVNELLTNSADHLETARSDGTVTDRHDAVHIALAAMTEAAVTLDRM
jgi:hypothetical protein